MEYRNEDQQLWEALSKLIDLPQHCVKMVITMEAGKETLVEITHKPTLLQGEVTELFKLELIE